jgi:hypothetical protein
LESNFILFGIFDPSDKPEKRFMKTNFQPKNGSAAYLVHLLPLLCWLLIATLACKKSNSGGGQPTGSTTYLTAINSYTAGTQVADSLSYDSTHRLVHLGYFGYDSLSGINPTIDSQFYAFSFSPNEVVPNGYVFTYFQNGVFNDSHQLTFDGENRIIKDTSFSGTGYVAYYSYPANEIAITILYNGLFSSSQTDTLLLTNGNVTAQHIYVPNSEVTADSLVADLEFTYGSYANPGYDSAFSSSAGPLLMVLTSNAFGGYEDFISKNLVVAISGYGNGFPANGGITLTPTAISNGKVTHLAETIGAIPASVVFTYK